ncbi:MAG: DUF4430 domain-containing protein [Clostridia bacterium]|nr:DUF4430 domain-containing protein [Clostridia bacterium]
MKKVLSLLLVLITVFAVVSCSAAENDVWADATYTEDTTVGQGAKSFIFEVKAEEKTVTLTVKTDEETVGAALEKLGLLEGEIGDFGLYVKKVNGMKADYDTDGVYWAFYVDGSYALTGVDLTPITDGAVYCFSREK